MLKFIEKKQILRISLSALDKSFGSLAGICFHFHVIVFVFDFHVGLIPSTICGNRIFDFKNNPIPEI